MPIESRKSRGLAATVAVSVACLALASGCKSATTSSGAAGQPTGGNPSAAGSAGGATAAATSAPAAAAGSSNRFTACPTQALVSSALGVSVPAPVQNGDAGSLVCNYSDSGASADVVIALSALPAGSASASVLKTVADTQAQAQGVTATAVSGLGDAAYMFTMKDAAANPSGVATTVLIVFVGTEDVDITAQTPADKVEALAHAIIGS